MLMSIAAWIFLGLVVSSLGGRIFNPTGEHAAVEAAIGVIGAVLGGFIFALASGMTPMKGLNLSSLPVAFAGAATLLVAYHAFYRRRRDHTRRVG